MFGKKKEKINGELWDWANFQTTEGFPISENLLDWVVGQEHAMKECQLCIDEWMHKLKGLKKRKWWRFWEKPELKKPCGKDQLSPAPSLFLLGDAGTGKSLMGRALASHLTFLCKKFKIPLYDIICWKNEVNPSEPRISIVSSPKGRAIVRRLRQKSLKKGFLSKWGFRILQWGMIGFGILIVGFVLYHLISNWMFPNPIVYYTDYGVELIPKTPDGYPMSFVKYIKEQGYLTFGEYWANNGGLISYLMNGLVSNVQLLYMGIASISMGAMLFIFKHIIGRFGGTKKGIGGAESLDSPKLIVDNSSGNAPFIDATGHGSSQLFGSIAWDPYQTGGLGTPEHQRVSAGEVHRAFMGILYIDEIKNLSPSEAVTLLTVLEDGQLPISLRSHGSISGDTAAMSVATEPVPCLNFLVAAGNFDCYSDDTDVLSEHGLVKWDKLRVGDKVWSLNVKTGEMELKPIKRIPIYDYKGKMLWLHGKQYDNIVTPNHKILLYRKHGGCRDIPLSYGNLEYEKAEKAFKHWTFRLPTTAKWIGENPKIEFVKDIDKRANKLPIVKIEDLYELIGWYCSEGSLDHKRRYVIISNTERRELLLKLLSSMSLTYYPKSKNVILPYQQLYHFFKDFGYYSNEKRIPRYILSAKIPSLIRLFKGLMHGDGSKIDGKYYVYYTTSSFLRDTFIEICLKLGFHSTVKTIIPKKSKIRGRIINSILPQYHLYVQRKSKGYVEKKENMEWINYRGKIWCFEVEGNNNFLVGRNGKLCFSGNSIPQIHPALMDRIAGYGKVVRMNNEMPNTVENRRKYIQFISQEIKRFYLLPFSREACEELVNEGRRKSGFNNKLTTKFRPMISIIKTASILAMNEKKKVVDVEYIIEAVNEHCKSIQKQLLEYHFDRVKDYKYIEPTAEPRQGKIHGLYVSGFGDEGVGGVGVVKASMIKHKDKKKDGYFEVTGTKKTPKWIDDSIAKVRHVIEAKFDIDPAVGYSTMIDFQQQYNIDGPSAGITMTLALASIIEKKKIRQDIAVTGEVNIDSEGKIIITPIGGADQKIRAAMYWGFKKVIIPKKNLDHSIIPSDYKGIEIIGLETLEEYMNEVFE